jgi:hypothetical protein
MKNGGNGGRMYERTRGDLLPRDRTNSQRLTLQEGWADWYKGYNDALTGYAARSQDTNYVDGYTRGVSVKHGKPVQPVAPDQATERRHYVEAELAQAVAEIKHARQVAFDTDATERDMHLLREAEALLTRGRLEEARNTSREILARPVQPPSEPPPPPRAPRRASPPPPVRRRRYHHPSSEPPPAP